MSARSTGCAAAPRTFATLVWRDSFQRGPWSNSGGWLERRAQEWDELKQLARERNPNFGRVVRHWDNLDGPQVRRRSLDLNAAALDEASWYGWHVVQEGTTGLPVGRPASGITDPDLIRELAEAECNGYSLKQLLAPIGRGRTTAATKARRGELARVVREMRGGLQEINTKAMADTFDRSPSTIYKLATDGLFRIGKNSCKGGGSFWALQGWTRREPSLGPHDPNPPVRYETRDGRVFKVVTLPDDPRLRRPSVNRSGAWFKRRPEQAAGLAHPTGLARLPRFLECTAPPVCLSPVV